MRRFALFLAVVAMLSAPRLAVAQTDSPRVYIAYFKVDFTDLPAWIENYQEVETPILDGMVEEGILNGFGLTVHDTGGEYNLRMVLLTPDWGSIQDFWTAYYARMPEDALGRGESMIRQHTDEIWVMTESNEVEGAGPSTLVYESAWHIAFDQLEEWNANFDRYSRPALQRAMDEGLISGWAKLDHDTGGPWNVKLIYWPTDWDDIDELIAMLVAGGEQMDPEAMRSALGHEDHVWRMVPRSGM
jgi:hypothetical protein